MASRVLTRFSLNLGQWPNFDPTWPSFELGLDLMEIYVLLNLYDDWMQNVASRVLTSKCWRRTKDHHKNTTGNSDYGIFSFNVFDSRTPLKFHIDQIYGWEESLTFALIVVNHLKWNHQKLPKLSTKCFVLFNFKF